MEAMNFLNEVFVIGDFQIFDEFSSNVIPTMLELAYPLDFKNGRILEKHVYD